MSELLRRRHLVTYADTDPAGVIYYASWVPFLERLHTAWLLSNGFRDPEYESRFGVRSACRAITVDYLRPVHLFDQLDLVLRVDHIGTTSYRIRLDYELDGELTGYATMTVAFFAEQKAPIPDEIREALIRHQG
ncbi:acyl-CoA thioesterase [Enemella sp. A6]|uniref:acyl-CoA thioesterase n=1 Tax=Enemella sp. A6 TaxID=3440152 RepID=UPI003EBF3163